MYFIQNLINGKRYVGQTTRTVEERFKEHAKADSHLGRAIRKYGVENFKYGVIKTCATAEELNYWEKYFIAALKTKSPIGYNHTDGGDNGFTMSPETRAKLSAAGRGRKHSPESRAKMAAAHRGVKRSPETIAKMSAANKGKKLSAEHRAKISAAGRGRACSPETRAKIAAAHITL